MSDRRVAVVGATGAVGRTMIEVLSERDFPLADLRLLASARSAGSTVATRWGEIKVEDLEDADPSGIDIALFSAGADRSRCVSSAFCPGAGGHGSDTAARGTACRQGDAPACFAGGSDTGR